MVEIMIAWVQITLVTCYLLYNCPYFGHFSKMYIKITILCSGGTLTHLTAPGLLAGLNDVATSVTPALSSWFHTAILYVTLLLIVLLFLFFSVIVAMAWNATVVSSLEIRIPSRGCKGLKRWHMIKKIFLLNTVAVSFFPYVFFLLNNGIAVLSLHALWFKVMQPVLWSNILNHWSMSRSAGFWTVFYT